MTPSVTETYVRVENAVKQYGEYVVLTDVCCDLQEGKIHGLVGRNGSGKTVLMKAICGFVPLTSGTITVNGKQIGKDVDVPPDVGAIIESPGFLPNYNALQNLVFLAKITGGPGKEQLRHLIARVGLDPNSKKHVGKFSMGMRQRLGIAQAIMNDPRLLVLDEPFNGLDEQGAEDMRILLRSLRDEGRTLLVASHNPLDINELCDTVFQMSAGALHQIH